MNKEVMAHYESFGAHAGLVALKLVAVEQFGEQDAPQFLKGVAENWINKVKQNTDEQIKAMETNELASLGIFGGFIDDTKRKAKDDLEAVEKLIREALGV